MKKFASLFCVIAVLATSAIAASVADITDVTPKVDENPVPVKTPPPAYPEALMKEGVSGIAVVTVVIDENGDVLAAEARKASHDGFKAPAEEAVKGWKFTPAKLAGKAVKVKVAVPIKFNFSATASAQ
ncbi:energy transducer TonB [Nibricoccus sp. IMCC34717]|uniref:energy transducer TonB n=1 Tax=Nibricoccus sp. IMCC34717 TaxID=3034021 RepID=UPI00384BF0AB